jgi:predicted nucleic acid-binding protein
VIHYIQIASTCNATIYDSYFLALALETDSVLITADEVFLLKARHLPKITSLRLLQLTERPL